MISESFTPIENLLLCERSKPFIIKMTRDIKVSLRVLSHNKCYALRPVMAALSLILYTSIVDTVS